MASQGSASSPNPAARARIPGAAGVERGADLVAGAGRPGEDRDRPVEAEDPVGSEAAGVGVGVGCPERPDDPLARGQPGAEPLGRGLDGSGPVPEHPRADHQLEGRPGGELGRHQRDEVVAVAPELEDRGEPAPLEGEPLVGAVPGVDCRGGPALPVRGGRSARSRGGPPRGRRGASGRGPPRAPRGGAPGGARCGCPRCSSRARDAPGSPGTRRCRRGRRRTRRGGRASRVPPPAAVPPLRSRAPRGRARRRAPALLGLPERDPRRPASRPRRPPRARGSRGRRARRAPARPRSPRR